MRTSKPIGIARNAGLAYVYLLFLLVILFTMSMAFLVQAATRLDAVVLESDSAQLEYLAESAASHALWRLLNESFTPAPNIDLSVCLPADDAEEAMDGTMASGSDNNRLEFGTKKYVGVRFPGVAIPPGATITTAYVEFLSSNTTSETFTDLRVVGDDSDNALAFTTTAFNMTNRVKTSATVPWYISPNWVSGVRYKSPDLRTIIQEIVDRPGWASGNAVALMFESMDPAGGCKASALDGFPASDAARIHIEYGTPTSVDPNSYTMHSLGAGRYGYKIRWHTPTTFATVATIGVMGESVVQQSYVLYVLPDQPPVLLVVGDAATLTAGDSARKAMIEGWGYTVTPISDESPQSDFDDAAAGSDAIYVAQSVDAAQLSTKLRYSTAGLVLEKQMTEFGFAGSYLAKNGTQVDVVDNNHYITINFPTGLRTITSTPQPLSYLESGRAPGLNSLADVFNVGSIWGPGLSTIDVGGTLSGGGTASGRRVQLPWGGAAFSIASLNADGQQIMLRSLEWASGEDLVFVDQFVNNIAMSTRQQGKKYFGRATVHIKDANGNNVDGATVNGNWTGAVSEPDTGVTDFLGVVLIESSDVNGGGTYTFTVTDVIKPTFVYNPALKVETSESITAP